tara:strand:- start:72 stop:644 length:573 start_codon:yes stop_codon:yes gene_type:complete
MKDRKILDYIKNVDYDSLPQSYKDLRQQLTDVGKQYDKINRDKKKLNDKLQIIYKEQKSVSKEYTKLYKQLEVFNKSYSPKCYVISQLKKEITYLSFKIEYTKTTSIYLGKKDVVFNQLQPYIKNLNDKNYKYKINDFLTKKISELIDYDDPNWLDKNKVNLNTILNTMEKLNNDNSNNLSFGEMLKQYT